MWHRRHEHVLVAGAGPIGLGTAAFLAERGVPVEVVDPRWMPAESDFTVLLHPDSLRALEEEGVLTSLEPDSRRIDTIAIYDGADLRARADLGALPPAAVVSLGRLQQVFEDRLEAHRTRVHWHHRLRRVVDDGARIVADIDVLDRDSAGYAISHMGTSIARTLHDRPLFIIGADGRRSCVRRLMDIPWEDRGDPELIVGLELDTDLDLGSELRVTLDGEVSSVAWALPDGGLHVAMRVRSHRAKLETMSRLGDMPDRDAARRLIRWHLPWFDADVADVRWIDLARFEPHLAGRLGGGPAWLIGEAGYELEPVSSHCLNLALVQAHDLASLLGGVLDGQTPESSLADCERQFRAAAQERTRPEASFSASPSCDAWMARHYPDLLPLMPASGAALQRLAATLGLEA